MFQPGIETLCILSKDHEVYANIRIARLDPREAAYRAEVRKQVQFLAQHEIDALKSSSNRRGHRTFQANTNTLYRLQDGFGKLPSAPGDCLSVQFNRLPFHADTGGFDFANSGFGDLRPDSIARN